MSSVAAVPARRSSRWSSAGRKLPLRNQLILQLICIVISITVAFPLIYVISLSLRADESRPTQLEIIPSEVSLNAYRQVLTQPTANPVTFLELLRNSLFLSLGVASLAVLIAVTAAYAFSRLRFNGRQVLMIMIFFALLMPSVGLILPLFLLLNRFQIMDEAGKVVFNLRNSLAGVGIAMVAGGLPFAIWNLKGYLDTIPKELEEAAIIDGASFNQSFFRVVLPLATPALAVVFFLSFMGNWQEFGLSWQFLTNPKDYTLAMTLYNMVGQYAANIPWNRFCAMAVIIALPVAVVYIPLQKYIIGGLTLGGVKG